MDFREFRSKVVEIPVVYDDGDDTIAFTVGYRPREIVEEDLELLAQLQTARVADVAVEAPPQPNRATRRAAAKNGHAATPPRPARSPPG